MANAVNAVLSSPERGHRQRLQDPHKMCRLCFQEPGTHDVSKVPLLMQAIEQLYKVIIQPTDRYTKSVCEKCIVWVQEFSMHRDLVAGGQLLFSKRIEMLEQMSHMKAEPCNTDREGPPGAVNCTPLPMVDKQEESDLDMDDTMTEAPTSPQNQSPSISPPLSHDDEQMDEEMIAANKRTHEKQKEQIQSLKIQRTSDASSYRIVTNGKGMRSIHSRPQTPMHFKREPSPTPSEHSSRNGKLSQPRELNALLNDDHAKQAARVAKRRSTMASHCHDSDATNTLAGRKRRLSCSTKDAGDTENNGINLRTRKASGSGAGGYNGDINTSPASTSKRMRVEHTPVKSNGAAAAAQMHSTTPKRNDTPKRGRADSNSLSSNIVAASAVDTTATAVVALSTPRSNKSTSRRDKSKAAAAATTPRITQFFAQQKTSTPVPPLNSNAAATAAPIKTSTPAPSPAPSPAPASLMCDTCSIILSSVNELNFHKKSHELSCCIKCKKPIDAAENPISAHVVSCFLLDNKLSSDLLTRFLKVKVDLDRLTPVKIKQIQKNLQSNEAHNDGSAKSSANFDSSRGNAKSHNRESNANEPPDSVNRRKSKDKSRRDSGENAQNSSDGQNKSVDGKSDSERHGSKKSKNKKFNANKSSTAKTVHADFSDDLLITENTSTAVNWNDEPNKDKVFSLRNFDCDASIYVNIKEVLSTGTPETQHKVANFVKRISLLKQKVSAPPPQQRTASPVVHVIQKPHVPVPAQAPSPAVAAVAVPHKATNGFAPGPVAPNQLVNVRQLSTMQTPAHLQSLQSALARQNSPNMVHAPIASIQNTKTVPYTAVSMHALHATHMVQSPQVACASQAAQAQAAQAAPLANMQPIAYAPNESNTPNVPRLLDLPHRGRPRNRAYSIHFVPNDQLPKISARRQSHGSGLLTSLLAIQPVQTDSAASAAVAADANANAALSTAAIAPPDHTYTRSTVSNPPNYRPQSGDRPTPPLSQTPPYMTHIHARDIVVSAVRSCATPYPTQNPTPNPAPNPVPSPAPSPAPNPPTTLKILTVDDLNSRAANSIQPIQSVASNRTDSPNSTENNSNLNNNNQPATVKRVRTKTTPMRNGGVQISDDANITISVSLTKLGVDQAELSLTTEPHGRISYDALTDKRKQEVQSSLLKDDVWVKMLKHLRTIRPTNDTMQLFRQILPAHQHNIFMTELRKVYGARI